MSGTGASNHPVGAPSADCPACPRSLPLDRRPHLHVPGLPAPPARLQTRARLSAGRHRAQSRTARQRRCRRPLRDRSPQLRQIRRRLLSTRTRLRKAADRLRRQQRPGCANTLTACSPKPPVRGNDAIDDTAAKDLNAYFKDGYLSTYGHATSVAALVLDRLPSVNYAGVPEAFRSMSPPAQRELSRHAGCRRLL
jgi:hypothetical protein